MYHMVESYDFYAMEIAFSIWLPIPVYRGATGNLGSEQICTTQARPYFVYAAI